MEHAAALAQLRDEAAAKDGHAATAAAAQDQHATASALAAAQEEEDAMSQRAAQTAAERLNGTPMGGRAIWVGDPMLPPDVMERATELETK